MRLPLLAALIAVTALAGCAGFRSSRINPLNWFGPSQSAGVIGATQIVVDPRPLVAQLLSMKIEAFAGGAIIRATGLPPTQGYWDAELVAVPVADEGVLVFEFRLFPPPATKPARTPQSREITVATSLADAELAGVSRIVVQGASNALSVNR